MKLTNAALGLLALSIVFQAASAGADVLPPGAKGVKNSLAIEGKLPPDKALLIANTFYGATQTKIGGFVDVSWHPLSGPMRLYLVDAAVAAKVPQVGERNGSDELKALAEKGIACSSEFSGTRTLPETEPADEVRLVFHVDATATACSSTLARTDYFAKDGKPVAGPGGQTPPPPAPTESPRSTPDPVASASPAGNAPRSGCAACAVASDVPSSLGPLGPLAALALATLVFRRRRR